jgi:hypothetical protein
MEKALVEMHAECLLEIFKFRNVGLGQRLMGLTFITPSSHRVYF